MSPASSRLNPFPGLRPFTQEEDYLFFGREEQTLELLQRLGSNRFVAVVGTSGSGKSSLVRCGLLSELLGGRMLDAGAAWEIAVTHPGGNPLALLTDALLDADLYDREAEDARENLLATLSRSHFGLVEAVKQADLGEGTNFLLVVDQFEEIFRFHEAGQRQQEVANEFVSLLLEASAQKDVPIYVVLTMRSDFIGECGQFEGLAEMVNRGEFLIPRLTREQYKRVIEGPIKVAGGKIEPRLLQRLLNDLGQQADQLPCLQHALMRTWDVWTAKGDTDALDLDDYQRVGKMSQALSLHADELYELLANDRQRELCKGIFQALTVEESNSRGIRRPQRLGRLCQILEVPSEELTPIIDAYRQSGVTFLMPSPDVELTDQTIIDISHESLMRVWTRLRQWVEEETQAAGIYHRLSESADLHEQGKAGLFRDPELGIALAWRETKRPNAAWAERYRPGFATAITFLDASQKASVAEEQALEAARQRELEQAQKLAEAQQLRLEQQQRAARKLRTMLAGLAAVAVVAVVACFVALVANNKANELTKIASREADNAKQEQRKTETALTEVALQREKAEGLLQKSISAEKAALEAEQRSREYRYATDMQLAATLAADSTANSGQVLTRLSDHDPGENATLAGKPDLRGFEWHYLKQLAEGRASIIKGFDKDVVDTALSPEGELVTLTSDSRLQRWNAATRQETRPALDLKKGRTIGVQALSRDGRQAAVAVGDQVSLVDAVAGQERARTIPALTRGGLLFSPDGRMVITVDTGVGWWDAATGKPVAVQDFKLTHYPGSENKTPISVSADGLTLAVGGQGTYRGSFSVFRLNPQTREVTALANAAGDTGTKRTLAISPDGQTVAVSLFFQGALALYDAATGKLLHRESSAHSASISAIAFRADGSELATASLDGTIKLWKDFKTLDVAKATSLMGHSDQVVAMAYSSGESRLISAGQDKSVRLWNLEQTTSSLHRVIPGSGGLRARYSPDGTLMAIANEPQLQLRDGTTGQVLRHFPRRNDGMSADSVAFSPDGRLLAAGFGGTKDVSLIELWDIDRRERIAELPGTTAIPGFTTTYHTGIVGALAFSPDGKHLVAGFGSLNLLGWGDRGKFPLLVYNVAAKRVVRRLEGHGNTCASVVFSPDGTRMASASMDCTARIWDAATWQELDVLHNPDPATDLGQRRVYDVAFSPDGKLLAMASAEGHVVIWDAETGEYRQTLRGHANEVWSVAFSPDGLTLASGSIDNTVRLWNVATWRELVRLDPKVPMDSRALVFSPDGRRLLSAGFRGGTVVWSVQPTGEPSGPKLEQLSQWLKTGDGFQSRVRMYSENLRLFEPLEQLAQQSPDNGVVQAALAATRANWHASRQEWKPAVEQFDRLRQLGAKSPDAWLSTPGRLRLAEALLHEQRPADAAALLTGGENPRVDDGGGTRGVAFGFEYSYDQFPLKLSRVYRGSPAWKAGLRAGDRLLKFNDVELTAKTAADYVKAATGGEGTKLQLTIQRSGQEQPDAVELTKVSHIQDDVTVEQIERLLAAVDGKLSDSPNDPGLLELRAELAGQSSENDRQVADYTAAIAVLETQEPQPTSDLQRLHRRRGDAYVRLKQWQLALDDYANGVTAETTDEELLANRASAQAEVLVAGRKESLENVWIEDAPPAGAKLEGDTPWEIVGRPAHPVYSGEKSFRRQAEGISQHFLTEGKPALKITNGGVLFAYLYLDPQDPPKTVMMQFNDGQWEHRAYWGEDLIPWGLPGTVGRVAMGPLPKTGEWVRLEVPVDKVGLKPGAELNGWAFTQFAGTCYWDRAGTTGSLGSYDSPWQELAAAYRLVDDQPAIDQLVEQRPQSAGLIGDLFTQGDNQDGPRAIALYSRAVAHDTTDVDLLARRARAYEELKDWPAAAADWSRAVGENPERVKFLTEFATRLEKSEQRALADAQRQRARQVLEAALKGDPDDTPVADRLAEILLDLSEQKSPEWTTVTPAVSTTGGATLAVQDDRSIVVQQGLDIVTLPAAGRPVSAIRLETSPEAAPPADGAAAFTEYRIVSTRTTAEGLRGRYVRIDLPGDNKQFPRYVGDDDRKMLNLTEVQVFQEAKNIAQGKSAQQNGTYGDSFGEWEAGRAVDGNTDSSLEARSIAHTGGDYRNPWWEVDLGREEVIDRVVIWNRTTHFLRMKHFRVRVLDDERQVLYEETIDEAPNPSREIRPDSVQLTLQQPTAAGEAPAWQVRFTNPLDARPWKRFRISTLETLTPLTVESDSSALNWSVPKPVQRTSSGSRKMTAQDDGSYIVEATSTDKLPLPALPETAKTIRIETAATIAALPSDAPVFSEYRVQAIGAAIADSGAIQGRYVRIDLPGDNQQFPRYPQDGVRKSVVLAEVEVFQGNTNLARGRTARQSSTSADRTADLAVDGNTDGRDLANAKDSVAMTDELRTGAEPWWEVDLGSMQPIDRVVVWKAFWGGSEERMRHFRVRFLDADHRVVFEQTVDQAPNPSREISYRSLIEKTAPKTGEGPPQWALRLDKDTGVDPGGRFRISTAETINSLQREDAIAEARKVAFPAARLAAAYDLNGQPAASADWFGRALASVQADPQRKPVLASLQEHPESLAELLRRQPDDRQLSLAEARRLVQQGVKALDEQDAGRALASLQSARKLFENWLAHTPEQHWTVLTPVEMRAEHGSRLTLQPDGSVFVQQPAAKDTYTLVVPWDLKDVRGLRLEALADARLPLGGPGWAGNGNFHLRHLSLQATTADKPGSPRAIALRNAQADFTERGWDFRGVVTGRGNSGWSVLPEVNQNHTALFEVSEEVSDDRGTQLTIVLHFESEYEKHLLGRFRLSFTSDAATLPATRQRFDLKDSELTALDVALGKAFAQQKNATEAAAALARALNRTPEEKDRKPLIEQFPQEAAVLTLLAEQHPQDLLLQLALAKHLAQNGKKALGENRQDEALPQLAQARELFSRLAAERPDSTWTVLQPTEMASEGGAELALEPDGSIFVSGNNPDRDTYTITAPLAGGGLTALRLETIPDERLPGQGAGRSDGAGEFLLAEVDVVLKANSGNSRPLAIPSGVADFARVDVSPQPIAQAFDANDETYWGVLPRLKEAHTAVFLLDPLAEGAGADHSLVIRLKCGTRNYPRRNLGRFRLSVTSDANAIAAAKFHQELKASGLADLERSLGNVHGRQARVADAAAAFRQALDLAADRDARLIILQEASAHAGVLDQLTALRAADAAFLDVLARHYQQGGDIPSARMAAAKARERYEQRLAAEPSNARLTKDLADLLLDVSPVELATRNWTILKPTEMKSEGGATLTVLDDGSILAGGNAANNEVYTITTKVGLANIQAFLLEAIPHESLPHGSSGRRPSDGDFALTEFKIAQSSDGRPGAFAAVPLTLAICDYSQPHSPVANVLDGKDSTFWDILPHVQQPHYAAFAPAAPLTLSAEGMLAFTLEFKLGQPLGLGRFRLSATDNPEALSMEQARLLAVKLDNPWLRLGVAYRSVGEFDRALDTAARAIELAGSSSAKAAATQQAAAFDDLFARLLERFPDDPALRLGQAKHLAAMHTAANQFQTAVDVLSTVIAVFPDDLELRNLRAAALMKLGRWPDADADYARVIDRETDAGRRRTAERTRAEVQLRIGQFQDGAEAFLQEMFLDTGSQDRPREASIAELLADNRDIARMASQKLYEKTHSNTDSGYSWGLVQVFTAQPGLVTKENSQKLLDAAKRAGSTQVEVLTASIHYRLGNLKEAEPLLTTKIDEPQLHALAALLLFDQGKLEESRLRWKQVHDWFERERAQDPGSVIPIQQGWQNWAVRVAVYREATRKLIGTRIKELDELLAKEPDRTPELLERARLLADADLSDEALRDLDRLAALKVDTVEAHALHGRVLTALNRAEDALVHLHQVIAAGTQDAGVYAARGALLLRQGQTAEARADLERSLDLKPNELAARAMADLLLADQDNVTNWTVLKPTDMKSAGGATLTGQDDGSILASGTNAPGDVYTLTAVAGLDRIAAIRLEVLPDRSLPNNGPGRHSTGNFQLKAMRLHHPAAQGESDDTRLPLASAWASFDYKASNADVGGLVDERLNKVWHVWGQIGQPHQAVFLVKEPSANSQGRPLVVELLQNDDNEANNLGRFRLSVSNDPAVFDREQKRFAARQLTDPWAKLAAAYILAGDTDRAVDLLARPWNKDQIAALVASGCLTGEVLDALQARHPDACASVVPEAASVAAARGELDLARILYQRLVKWQPANPQWKERIAQLQPGVFAIWNFDTTTGSWGSPIGCELSVKDGVLTVRKTGNDPAFQSPVTGPAGTKSLILRYRAAQAFEMQLFWSDETGEFSDERHWDYSIPASTGEWREIMLPFRCEGKLNKLRLDPNTANDQGVEIDSIVLRQLDPAEYARIVNETLIEPELAKLAIPADSLSAEKYAARAKFLTRLGRWREANVAFEQERKLSPPDRSKWFMVAIIRLLAEDTEGYQELCQAMVEQFRDSTDPQFADSVCKACLLSPGAIELSELPIKFLRDSTNDPKLDKGVFHWFVACCALISYREDNFEEAIAWTKKHPNLTGQSGSLALVVRAMAEHQLGQKEGAAKTLAQAAAIIPAELRTLGTDDYSGPLPVSAEKVAHDWLALVILFREANSLINEKSDPPNN